MGLNICHINPSNVVFGHSIQSLICDAFIFLLYFIVAAHVQIKEIIAYLSTHAWTKYIKLLNVFGLFPFVVAQTSVY